MFLRRERIHPLRERKRGDVLDDEPGADVHAVHFCKVYGGIFTAKVLFKGAHSGFAHEGAAFCVLAEIHLGGVHLHFIGEIAHLH